MTLLSTFDTICGEIQSIQAIFCGEMMDSEAFEESMGVRKGHGRKMKKPIKLTLKILEFQLIRESHLKKHMLETIPIFSSFLQLKTACDASFNKKVVWVSGIGWEMGSLSLGTRSRLKRLLW